MAFGDSLTPMSKISKEEKKSVRYSDRRYRQQSEEQWEATRLQDEYHFTRQLQDETLNKDRRKKFQKESKLSSIRAAIKNRISDRLYRKYDETVIGEDLEDQSRKLKLHHANGTKLMNEGHDVLEIDLAGSSFDLFRKEHTGFKGKGFEALGAALAEHKNIGKSADHIAQFMGKKWEICWIWFMSAGKQDSKILIRLFAPA